VGGDHHWFVVHAAIWTFILALPRADRLMRYMVTWGGRKSAGIRH
jgi:hypothetical protein